MTDRPAELTVDDRTIAVAVAQFAPGDDRVHNRDVVAGLIAVAASRGARLVILPEYASYFTDPLGPSFARNAEPLDGDFVGSLSAAAREHGLFVVAGLVERTDQAHRFSNTLVAVGPSGDVLATYRKQHLYDAFGAKESEWVVPGDLDEPQTFEVDGVTVGLQTCYDLRFPEVTRRLADAGALLVAVPAEWVRGPLKEFHWSTLLAARAIENTLYVAAADHPPSIGVGASAILDPMGVTLAGLADTTGVAVADVSVARVREVRERNPALALRRYRVSPL
ncbi:Predicted amidohydrolase [Leifsonia sp. 98AMF]|jgi:predicted amidohydrolase|uniref:carbon-nitrogen hydrolase family protein n=1 Tax=unclassified Leifsonia TaxID=2663824 RepID=UPI00087A2859|nr:MULTISPECIES: carbon-nitrogen hydrolase family protein [unclassified Leifsonia]SDH27560.1 Predicted amidohydrolase [Leifsonia sp. 197AMF]SDJ11001.1 Predicted amidohydrolase [Leifsonia sp. 466MF]SDJ59157.1 Predicted amidohydrolase [Leifsonia sp. 157MF]SDN32288.1 Predicted amidohydrolase [Leifsonia sp. 509MF]SEM89187.1 Predicted amidohydrolase [Leifsonia sp. 467MF]